MFCAFIKQDGCENALKKWKLKEALVTARDWMDNERERLSSIVWRTGYDDYLTTITTNVNFLYSTFQQSEDLPDDQLHDSGIQVGSSSK